MVLFLGLGNINAQTQYGGSAYVYVQNKRTGEKRVINQTIRCYSNSKSKAKQRLKGYLKLGYNEEATSQIYYDIDSCDDDSNYSYGGSASVEVKNTRTGEKRVINQTIGCYSKSKSEAKQRLKGYLKPSYNEETTSQIYYEIDSCQD